jgi:uncharacterized protein YndB with AHSA1/START domain
MKKPLIISDEISINAPIEKVWNALIDPAQTKLYMFGCEALSDWKIGSPLIWKGVFDGAEVVAVTGKIVALEKQKHLAYTTFDPNGTLQDVPENYTTVTYDLTEQNDMTLLRVTQGDFSEVGDGERRYNDTMSGGGWKSILVEIKKIAELSE